MVFTSPSLDIDYRFARRDFHKDQVELSSSIQILCASDLRILDQCPYVIQVTTFSLLTVEDVILINTPAVPAVNLLRERTHPAIIVHAITWTAIQSRTSQTYAQRMVRGTQAVETSAVQVPVKIWWEPRVQMLEYVSDQFGSLNCRMFACVRIDRYIVESSGLGQKDNGHWAAAVGETTEVDVSEPTDGITDVQEVV